MPSVHLDVQLGLLDYWKIVWNRKLLVLAAIAIFIGAAVGLDSVRTKQYSATSNLLFVSQTYSSGGTVVALTPQDIATQIQIVNGASVRALATLALRQVPPSPQVVQVGLTAVAAITVTSSHRAFAARAANAYAFAYIKSSQDRYLGTVQAASSQLQSQVNALQSQITDLQGQVVSLKGGALSALVTRLGNLTAQQQALRTQLSQLQVNAAQAPSGGQVVAPATVPTSPSSPKPLVDAILAGFLGLILAVAYVLMREFLDDRIKAQQQLESITEGLPVLGIIPRLPEWKNRKDHPLITVQRPKSPPAEAYRGLRTSVQFAGLERKAKVIEVTSASMGEGKTTTSANLAVSLAETGAEVVVVGADLRKPRIHEFFDIDNDKGMTSVLVGEVSLDEVLKPVAEIEHLTVLPSGPVPPNPSELLGSRQARELLEDLTQRFDYVVLDSPPVLPVTDAAVLSGAVDVVVLVCAANDTTIKQLSKALQLLEQVDAPMLGTVLNGASESDAYVYYRYGDSKGYGYGDVNIAYEQTGSKRSSRRSSGGGSGPAEDEVTA